MMIYLPNNFKQYTCMITIKNIIDFVHITDNNANITTNIKSKHKILKYMVRLIENNVM